jgi:hypothetical protein
MFVRVLSSDYCQGRGDGRLVEAIGSLVVLRAFGS